MRLCKFYKKVKGKLRLIIGIWRTRGKVVSPIPVQINCWIIFLLATLSYALSCGNPVAAIFFEWPRQALKISNGATGPGRVEIPKPGCPIQWFSKISHQSLFLPCQVMPGNCHLLKDML